MKNPLVKAIAALACTLCWISTSPAQTASFTFSDNNGAPNSVLTNFGQSFTFDVFLNFTPGGSVPNVAGVSYWLQQNSGGPFNFAITNRDMTGSLFTDAQTPGMSYPQALAPTNASDLGAILASSGTGLGAGTYFIARITVSVSNTAFPGTYSIGSTFAGFRTSVISDSAGNTFAVAPGTYQVVVAPDTGSTLLLLGMGALALVGLARRQRARA